MHSSHRRERISYLMTIGGILISQIFSISKIPKSSRIAILTWVDASSPSARVANATLVTIKISEHLIHSINDMMKVIAMITPSNYCELFYSNLLSREAIGKRYVVSRWVEVSTGFSCRIFCTSWYEISLLNKAKQSLTTANKVWSPQLPIIFLNQITFSLNWFYVQQGLSLRLARLNYADFLFNFFFLVSFLVYYAWGFIIEILIIYNSLNFNFF